ncbi:hypothetical protein OO007_18825 [Cocleimonas sp. KMM 6892]|uniref:hypothetical protein n=1 Tax=unclassified Cocleimonas TaxID=2639732 RepID=UPI002DB65D7D|nr:MULTISPECIES: hypothetical protein [unclassified Cocleimonas]MEB8434299.1 hypothetical protein [Cocleimonas sp. KMM 6892]MEC4717082.1 hypothetical protein [Cocleimonas sp. KMM 6895]MEC4746571.1 hypothetical protein [Cocleimonas sp. KMM 6896]
MSLENQISISGELAKLFNYCEVYDSPASVGTDAFSVSDGILLRYILDEVSNPQNWLSLMKNEIKEIRDKVTMFGLENKDIDIAFVYPSNTDLPEFYLDYEDVSQWLTSWLNLFEYVQNANAVRFPQSKT